MNTIRIASLLFFVTLSSLAQTQRVSFQLTNAKFNEVVSTIEKQTVFRFYYNEKETDTLTITYSAQNLPLNQVLNEVLLPNNFRYGFGQNNRIYITKEVPILPFLKNVHEQTAKERDGQIAISDFVESTEEDISIENRLFEIGNKANPQKGVKTLAGYVKSLATGASVSSATISIIGKPISVQTDEYGYFSINVEEERSTLLISSVGLKQTQRQLAMYSSGRLDINMSDEVFSLGEVVVSGERGNQVKRTQMGLEKLSIRTIKQTPAVFGETDVISVILTLPGVQTVGEAASGFNVRGGATDQNLVLFSDATIYNSSHFFGLFSAFNGDAVSQVELYKSSIPARFGGRLSSVLDVTMKEGNRKKFSGSGGIGLLTGRLSLEGPIGKKTQILASGRSTYSDWLLRLIPDDTYKNSSAQFYDANVQITHQASDKDDFYLTAYTSKDKFSFQNGITYGYENISANAKWKRIINNHLYGTLTVGQDNYNFNIEDNSNLANAFNLKYAIRQSFARLDFYHNASNRHRLNYGVQTTLYKVKPGEMLPLGLESNTRYDKLDEEQALESAIYVSDSYTVNDKITIDAGIRYVMYSYLGPRNVNTYASGVPKSEETILETIQYGAGKNIKTYSSPEFRLGARYAFSNFSSIKLGYNSLRQYIHMLSNTTAATPTDSWKLSDSHIKPQFGDQVSLGYYQNFPSRKIETSVEVYYKRMHDYLDYKSGARLLMNKTIETDVVGTEARAYGIELLAKKNTGKLNGWVSYTYSKVQQRTTSNDPAEMINDGKYYNSNFDKPHNLTFVGNFRFSHRYSFSLNSTYSTGRPITLPIAKYDYAGSERVYYSERNKYRIPDFFRMDAAINIEGNHKIKKLAHSSWTIGVYNLTGRKNPFSVYFVSEEGKLNGYKLSIFGHQIPFITYNFRF
jgi:hypothetical protein